MQCEISQHEKQLPQIEQAILRTASSCNILISLTVGAMNNFEALLIARLVESTDGESDSISERGQYSAGNSGQGVLDTTDDNIYGTNSSPDAKHDCMRLRCELKDLDDYSNNTMMTPPNEDWTLYSKVTTIIRNQNDS